MNLRRIASAPWRGLKSITRMTFPRGASWHSWVLPAGMRKLEQLKDRQATSVIMAPLLWLQRTFPEAPIVVNAITDEGQSELVAKHELPQLLKHPNDFYTGTVMWMGVLADLVLDGNGYLLKVRNQIDKPRELWWAWSGTMEPKGDEGTFITHYEYTPNGIPIRVEPEDVIHFRFGMDPDNPRKGLSPLRSVLNEVMTDEEAQQFTSSLLQNMGVPGIVISPDPKQPAPGADDVAETKTYIRDNFTGQRRGEPLVLGGATQVQTFGFSPQQMNLREIRRIPEERVTAVTGVPAIVAGLGAGLDRSTFANMSEAREMAYESGMMPLQRLISEQLDLQLLPDFEERTADFEVKFDTSKVRVLQEDETKKVERLNVGVTGGWIPVAYAQREGFGIEPTDADEVYLRTLNQIEVPVGEPMDPAEDDGVDDPPEPPEQPPPPDPEDEPGDGDPDDEA